MVTITTLLALFYPVISWGVVSYIGVQYFRVNGEQFRDVLSSAICIPIVNTVVLSILIWCFSGNISRLLDVPEEWVRFLPIMSAAAFLPPLAQNILRVKNRPEGFAAIELSVALINFVVTVALVIGIGMAWEGRILAVLAANVCLSLLAAAWLLRTRVLAFVWQFREIVAAFQFGAGVVPHELASQAMRLADRLLIVTMIGQSAAGEYAVATQIASVMLVMLSALNSAWTPFVFSSLKKGTESDTKALVLKTYMVHGGLVAFCIAFNLLVPFMYDVLVAKEFHGSMDYVVWISIGFLFNGVQLTFVDYIYFQKRTAILAAVTSVSALANLTLAWLLIGRAGPIGAPVAFAVVSGLAMCLTFMISYRVQPMPWLSAIINCGRDRSLR